MPKRSQSNTAASKISLFQTGHTWKVIRNEARALADEHLKNGIAQGGPLTLQLEKSLEETFNRKYCIAVASCTDALTIALVALNLRAGSKVAVSNYTFTATAHAIERAGYVPWAVDVGFDYCIKASKIPSDVKAVVAVDLFGNMCDWAALKALNIPIICDAAQSFESKNWEGFSAQQGIASCLSFSPSKTMNSFGSGGAILTDDPHINEVCRKLRLHGKIKNNMPAIHPGLNSMMSTQEIANVLVCMRYANAWLERRQAIHKYIYDQLNRDIACASNTTYTNSLHKMVLYSLNREKYQDQLTEANIDHAIHYEMLVNDEPLYNNHEIYKVSDLLRACSFTIPNQHTLTDTEVERIAKALK